MAAMEFLLILLEFFAIVGAIWAALCFIIIPLFRYLAVRTVLYFRCLFSKAKFSAVGFMSFIVPHFTSGKPDYFLLSGKKLYAVKLKSYRKSRTKIKVISDVHWQIESIRQPHYGSGSALSKITEKIHDLMVHKRLRKAPTKLALYAKKINRALADTGVDCVPLLLINPAVKDILTGDDITLIDGDTVYYGVMIANSFYPKNLSRPDMSKAEISSILKVAKKQLKGKL